MEVSDMSVVVVDEVGVLTDRVKMARERMRSATSHVCAERSRLHTLAWQESEGEPLDIRWARIFERSLDERTIVIRASSI